MPIIESQQVYTTESIKEHHINPSVLEGEFGYDSLLGPGVAVQIERAPPVNTTPPSISGSLRIPEVLTCNPGVWTGSPSPQYTYRWFTDGVEIPGETSKTMTTFNELTDTVITCEVIAFNPLDSAVVLTPVGVTVQLVEPVDLFEMGYYAVTGLAQPSRLFNSEVNTYVVTGISVDQQQSIFELDIYAVEFL